MKKFLSVIGFCCLFASQSNAALIFVDVGATGQQLENGFAGLTNATSGTFNGVSIAILGDGTQDFRDRGDVTGLYGDLGEDFFFATTSITLTFANLAAGDYRFTSWHHDAEYEQSFLSINSSGTNALNFQPTTGYNPSEITSRTVFFSSNGSNSDIITFTENSEVRGTNSAVILNGFTIAKVPEPSTIVILALGFLGLAARRFKK
jgi:hypothetical protein